MNSNHMLVGLAGLISDENLTSFLPLRFKESLTSICDSAIFDPSSYFEFNPWNDDSKTSGSLKSQLASNLISPEDLILESSFNLPVRNIIYIPSTPPKVIKHSVRRILLSNQVSVDSSLEERFPIFDAFTLNYHFSPTKPKSDDKLENCYHIRTSPRELNMYLIGTVDIFSIRE